RSRREPRQGRPGFRDRLERRAGRERRARAIDPVHRGRGEGGERRRRCDPGRLGRRLLMLQVDVVTLFPLMFEAVTEHGVTGRARDRKVYDLVTWNPRDFAANAYRSVDDRPYGGGPGMVMMAEPLE